MALSGSNGNTIMRNSINGNDLLGIELFNSQGNTITENNVSSNGEVGLRLVNSNGNTITENTANFNILADPDDDGGITLDNSKCCYPNHRGRFH